MLLHNHGINHTFHAHGRMDPTRTTVLRKRFEQDLVRRFRRLAKDIRQAVEGDNALGIKVNAGQFDFPTSAEKVSAFMRWVRKQQDEGILEKQYGVSMDFAARRAWSNVYLRSAYQKGMARAYGQVRKGGIEVSDNWVDGGFFRPIHADRVGLIYTRTYSDLDGITKDMDTKISRKLADGIAHGYAPAKIADGIVETIDGIGIYRARMLARTEIIRAHAEASLNSYEEAGAEGVLIESEFATADDGSVCPKCEELANHVYSLDEARGLIPVHPNCRCAWLPVVSNTDGIRLM